MGWGMVMFESGQKFKRIFVCETAVEAESAQAAANQVVDDWAVPGGCGVNMREELGTMRINLRDGQLTPLAVWVEAMDVV